MGKNPTNYSMPIEDRQYGRIGAGLPDYIHNDTFDAENIEKQIFWGMNRNYYRGMEAQKRLCNIKKYTMSMEIFKIDNDLNNRYGFISNHSNGADGTHFKTYSAKIAWNLIDHQMVRDIKRLNIAATTDADAQSTWRCINPNVTDDPADSDHAYMLYKDSTGTIHTDPWHRPDYVVTKNANGEIITKRSVCNSPLSLFSNKHGEWYPIKKGKYMHAFTNKEMCARSDMFLYRTMFFINDLMYTNVLYGVDEKHLYIFISVDDNANLGVGDLISEEAMLHYIDRCAPFTLLTMPWGPTMTYDGPGNDPTFANGNGLSYNSYDNLTPTMKLKKNFWMLSCSWRGTNRWPTGLMATTFTNIDTIQEGPNKRDVFNIGQSSPSMLTSLLNNDMMVHSEAYCLPNIENYSFIGTKRVFQIPINGNPVPPENILLWAYTPTDSEDVMMTGKYSLLPYASVSLYYPNVYQVIDAPDDAEIMVMWFYDHEHETPNEYFTNVLDDYMKYNRSFASACVNDSLPQYIRDYIPAKVTYDYTDYERYNKSTMTDAQTYKVDKLTELMKDDPSRYEYIYTKLMESTATRLHANPKQTINLGKLSDAEFENAFRADLSDMDVVVTPDDQHWPDPILTEDYNKEDAWFDPFRNFSSMEFEERHLMLTIDHPFITKYQYTVWIDGIQYDDKHCYTKFLRTFIYIPESAISRYSVIEIEMMRIPEHGRVLAEVDFGDTDTSIKLPKVFEDVSPQNMMVSIRINTSTWKADSELSKQYEQQLKDPDIAEVAKNIGVTYFYQPASDYEMAWLLFGYNRYVDGKRQYLDEDGRVLPFKSLHEHWLEYPALPYPDPTKSRIYGRLIKDIVLVPEILPDGSIVTTERIRTRFMESLTNTIIEYRESADGKVLEQFDPNTFYIAENYCNKFFVCDNAQKTLVEYVIDESAAKFRELDYYKHSYRHYHNNADETFVSAQRIFVSAFLAFPSFSGDGGDRQGCMTSDGKIFSWEELSDSALYVVIGESKYEEYRYNKLDWKFEKIYSSDETDPDEDLSVLTTTLLAGSPNSKRWMELYAAFDEDVADPPPEKLISNPVSIESGLSSVRPKDSTMMVTAIDYPWCDGFYALDRRRFYQYLPYGEKSDRDIYLTPIGCPSNQAAVDVVTGYNRKMSEEMTNGEASYYPIDFDYAATNKADVIKDAYEVKRTRYYTSTEYPESYFSHKHALIQNCDIYHKHYLNFNYVKEDSVSLAHFYDEPTYQRFRVTINGYRLDHGTDYTTDMNAMVRFIRGDHVTFKFNKTSTTFIRAVQDSYLDAPRVEGEIDPSSSPNGGFGKDGEIEPECFIIYKQDSEGFIEGSSLSNPSSNVVYVDTKTNKEYIYNPKWPVEWATPTDEPWYDYEPRLVPYSNEAIADTGFTDTQVIIEYMPYKSRIVYKSPKLKSRMVSVTDQQLTRPLSLKYYDIYVGGIKLTENDVSFVTPRRMIIKENKFYEGARMTVYERCHDADLYGNEIAMPNSMNDIIAQHDPDFRKFLYSTR